MIRVEPISMIIVAIVFLARCVSWKSVPPRIVAKNTESRFSEITIATESEFFIARNCAYRKISVATETARMNL